MDLHYTSLAITLVLALQAFSVVRPQDPTWPPTAAPMSMFGESEVNGESGGGELLETDWNDSATLVATKPPPPISANPMLPEPVTTKAVLPADEQSTTKSPPAPQGNATATVPDTQVEPTVMPTVPPTPVSNETETSDTNLVDVSNATDTDPLNPTSNGTADAPNATATEAPGSNPSARPTTERAPSPTTATPTPTHTTVVPDTTIKAGDSANNTDRGLVSGETKSRRNGDAWGAIIGTALAVGFVGFIIYILLKKKGQREFMHRKLIEDMAPEPVHRLDNGEPLDLKFDGSAYYNPGLQGDNIQMTSFPQGHLH